MSCCSNLGSSPLARGAQHYHDHHGRRSRIIPACAESTTRTAVATQFVWDHPRLRGEHGPWPHHSCIRPGSSPLARGARVARHVRVVVDGIIPACAGSTHREAAAAARVGDHLRLRGEHQRDRQRLRPGRGSSPLARVARRAGVHARAGPGIIPACAGSTSSWRRFSIAWWDHPRLRGEHTSANVLTDGSSGSSPLARGARRAGLHARAGAGIIPACAGSTHHIVRPGEGGGDHPRLRGEH